MQALCHLLENQAAKAVQALYFANVNLSIDSNPDLNQFVSG